MSEAKSLDIAGILRALPHRYPLLKQEGDDTKKFSFNVGTQF